MTVSTFIRTASFGVVAIALAAAPVQAQRAAGYADAPRVAPVSREDIAATYQRGLDLVGQSKFGAARKEFRAAATMQQRNAELPHEALWQVAQAYHSENNTREAARTLDELATMAGAYGNPEVQVKALLEAAFLYRKSGDTMRSGEVVRDLRLLARSPFIDAGLRQQVERRIGA